MLKLTILSQFLMERIVFNTQGVPGTVCKKKCTIIFDIFNKEFQLCCEHSLQEEEAIKIEETRRLACQVEESQKVS